MSKKVLKFTSNTVLQILKWCDGEPTERVTGFTKAELSASPSLAEDVLGKLAKRFEKGGNV
jgi:hypothetical protein